MASQLLATRPGLRVAPATSTRLSRRSVVVKAANLSTIEKQYKEFRIPQIPVATVFGIAGWLVPAASPAPAFGGRSLLSVFTESIGQELSHFPTGPAMDSQFWLYLAIFHVGLFATMFFGLIGVSARMQGYFDK